MKPIVIFLSVFFAAAPLLVAQSQVLDQVVAVVNDEIITQSELDILLRPVYEQYKSEYKNQQLMKALYDAKKKLLNQLIEDRLVFQEAKTRKIEANDAEIEEQINLFKKRFKTEEEFEDALKRDGLTMTSLREKIRRQVMIRELQEMEIRAKVVISPLEVQEYFKAHADEFSNNDSIKVRSITIKKGNEAREKGLIDEASMERIKTVRVKIIEGEDFGTLAKQFSQDTHAKEGGLADWMERGSMIPVIDDVIFSLPVGQVSEVIETEMGYHLFRVDEKKEKQQKNFDQVKEEIFAKLYREKAEARFNEWLKELKKLAYISVR